MPASIHDSYSLRNLVVIACRILVDLGLDSGPFGNVSIRIPGSNEFWINSPGITFDQLTPADIVRTDLAGNLLEGDKAVHPGEFIHRQIMRLRPDVNAIVHTHSYHTVAMSLLGTTIEPYTQLGASIYGDQGLYQGFSGPVRTTDEGLSIAEALGNFAIVIAKNHGLFAVGSTMQAALWDMVVADQAARIHLQARQLGIHSADKLSDELLQKSKIEVRDKQCLFMWDSYVKKLSHTHPDIFTAKNSRRKLLCETELLM